MKDRKLSRSQREMLEIAREQIRRTSIDLVKIAVAGSGVSYVAELAQRESKLDARMPLNLKLCAVTQWDVIRSLNEVAGGDCWGAGHLDIIIRSFRKLQKSGARPMCLWLDKAGRMSPTDQENLASRITWAAANAGIKVRLVYLMQKVIAWSNREQEDVRDWVISSHVAARAQNWMFSDEGFEECLHDADADDEREIKIA